MKDLAEQAGAREAGHHEHVIEGSHTRCHRLVAKARLVEHIGQHRRVELLAELLEKAAIASLQYGSISPSPVALASRRPSFHIRQ
jgi:hypothetical protein